MLSRKASHAAACKPVLQQDLNAGASLRGRPMGAWIAAVWPDRVCQSCHLATCLVDFQQPFWLGYFQQHCCTKAAGLSHMLSVRTLEELLLSEAIGAQLVRGQTRPIPEWGINKLLACGYGWHHSARSHGALVKCLFPTVQSVGHGRQRHPVGDPVLEQKTASAALDDVKDLRAHIRTSLLHSC